MATNDDDIDIDLQYPEPDDAEYEQDADILVYINDSMDQWARNLRRMGHRDLATEASALASWRPRSQKTAVVGRAGSGKSTVMNAILQAPVLSTSSVGRACTAFPTEVIYEGENEYRAVISYVSRQQWEKTLTLLLDDINPDEDDLEDLFEAPDTSPSVEAEAALLSVYPHHKATFDDPIPNIQLTVNNLLDDPVVAPLLGGEQHITALSAESLEQELDGYLSGCRHDPSKPVLWSLVDIVRIYGPFEVLRSGMILVDLPGYGDRNVARAKRADDYLEEADNLILVCGIDRAVDEKETKDWMVKCIKRFAVFDNHKVEDGGLTVIITGLDRHVLDKDVRAYLTEEQANTLKDFQMQGEQATKRKIVAQRKVNEARTRKNSKLKSPMLRSQAERDMNLAIAEHEQHLTTLRLIAEKMQLFFAHVREDEVRSSVQNLYRATMLSTREGQDLVEIESIPVFVVGALDFFCLSGLVTLGTQCQVFNNIDATGVPALQAYIRTTGEKYFLSTVKGILVRGRTLLAEVQGQLEATVQQDMESLSTYESDAGSLFDALKVENVKTLLMGFKIIDEDQKSMETTLREGAMRAVVACPAAVKVLAKFKSNTYQALMRRNGILGNRDFNRFLTKHMESDSLERKWHKAFANDIPTHLKHLTGEISADFDRTKDQIVACAPPSIRAKIRAASDQLDARTALASARGRYLDVIDKVQRSYKGTFSNVLQTQLKPHYSRVAAQKGRGMLRRMKEENEQYFSAESSELFLGVVDSIVQSFRDAHDDGRKEFEEELERLYRHFQGSLVRMQGSIDGNQVATKDAKAMVALISDFNEKSDIFVEAIDSRLHHLANNGDAMAVDP